jgi:rhodanese-related sulfurtransferase
MPLTAAELVARARSRIRETPPAQLRDCLAQYTVIDVREPVEFACGHLDGAVNIPRGLLEFEISTNPRAGGATDPALADRSRPLLVVCQGGGRAALAAEVLQDLGYTQVASIQGGIRACVEAGLELKTITT